LGGGWLRSEIINLCLGSRIRRIGFPDETGGFIKGGHETLL